jgi:hypothetical protein
MSDTKKLVNDRVIEDDDNMYLRHRDNKEWPRAIRKPRPKISELPEHLISKKQIRGISSG